jgi:membrane associated rhomboid family serine protease
MTKYSILKRGDQSLWNNDASPSLRNDDPGTSPSCSCFPYSTVIVILSNIFIFVYGLHLIGFRNIKFTKTLPISLPNQNLVFLPISSWPDCENLKHEYWRLVSHQFVHAGFLHLLSNQSMLLLFGIFVEMSFGGWMSFMIYELGVLGGVLFHSACLPYRGLLGCSHGVYALYGASLSLCLSNVPPFSINSTYRFFLYASLALQFLSDVLSFIFYFNPSVGYMAHIGGFISGVLLGFAGLLFLPPRRFDFIKSSRDLLSLLSLVVLVVSISLISVKYVTLWPPETVIPLHFYHWIIENQNEGSCCEEMLEMVDFHQSNVSISNQMTTIQKSYYCNGFYLESYS